MTAGPYVLAGGKKIHIARTMSWSGGKNTLCGKRVTGDVSQLVYHADQDF